MTRMNGSHASHVDSDGSHASLARILYTLNFIAASVMSVDSSAMNSTIAEWLWTGHLFQYELAEVEGNHLYRCVV